MNTMTLDEMALRVMLNPDPRKRAGELARLARWAEQMHGGGACPDCGDAGPHDDNGAVRASELAFSCRACGMCFDAVR